MLTPLTSGDYQESDLLTAVARLKRDLANDEEVRTRLLDSIGDYLAMAGRLSEAEDLLIPALEGKTSGKRRLGHVALCAVDATVWPRSAAQLLSVG